MSLSAFLVWLWPFFLFVGWLWIWPATIKIVCQIFGWRSTALLYGRIWYRCCDLVKGRAVWFNLWFHSLYCGILIFGILKFLNLRILQYSFFAALANKTSLQTLFRSKQFFLPRGVLKMRFRCKLISGSNLCCFTDSINRIYKKILYRDWFSARLFVA